MQINNNKSNALKRSILIIDDDKCILLILDKVLSKAGYQVLTAENGEDGLDMVRQEKPDLVILDVILPDVNGLDICGRIKMDPLLKGIYVIIISGTKVEPVEKAHGLDLGADDYMTKPLDNREVLSRVQAMLRIKSAEEELYKAQQSLKQISSEYERVFHGTQEALFLVSVEGEQSFRFIRNNWAHQVATGISLDAIRNQTPEELLGKDLGRHLARNYTKCIEAGEPISYEESLNLPKGKKTWATTLTPVFESGKVKYIVGSAQDITMRKNIEEALKESEERFRTTLENLPGAIFAHDLEGNFLLVNKAASLNTGYSEEELMQMKVEDIDPYAGTREHRSRIWHNLKTGQSYVIESTHTKKDGSTYPAEVFLNALTMDKQLVLLAVAFDVSERKEAEEKLRFLATTDELTGLWNRRHFTQVAKNELERANRYQQIFSLLMLDIDHFKRINDTYGHAAGDVVLRHIAELIRKNLRQVDIAGRFGGEEFAIILPQTSLNGAYVIAERLRQNIEKLPARYNDTDIFFTVSIGVATYNKQIQTEDEIFKLADDALYEAKYKGRNLTVLRR